MSIDSADDTFITPCFKTVNGKEACTTARVAHTYEGPIVAEVSKP